MEKQQVSALSQLAAGLAGGLTTGDIAGAVTAAQAGKNAVENNLLSGLDGVGVSFQNYVNAQGSLVNNTNLTDENGEVLNPATPEEIKYASDKLVKGNLPEGQDPARGLLVAWAPVPAIAGSMFVVPATTAYGFLFSGALGGATDATQQLITMKPGETYSYTDTLIAIGTGSLTQGKGVIFTTVVNGGAYLGSSIKHEDPTASVVDSIFCSVQGGTTSNKVPFRKLSLYSVIPYLMKLLMKHS